ncbi:MAG: hypothetical protein ABI091_32170 [Ferruginibacter sp.]
MQTIKNIQFTKLLKVSGYLKEFNFRKSNIGPNGRFSVDTIDERGNRIMFYMELSESNWKIIQKDDLPKWIIEQENNLDEAIREIIN